MIYTHLPTQTVNKLVPGMHNLAGSAGCASFQSNHKWLDDITDQFLTQVFQEISLYMQGRSLRMFDIDDFFFLDICLTESCDGYFQCRANCCKVLTEGDDFPVSLLEEKNEDGKII